MSARSFIDHFHEITFFVCPRGVIHNARGRYDKAIERFDQAIKCDTSSGLAFGNRGIAKRNKGDNAGAVVDFTRALELLGDDVSFLKQRAVCYRVMQNYDAALRDYNMALKIGINFSPRFYFPPKCLLCLFCFFCFVFFVFFWICFFCYCTEPKSAELLYQRSRVWMRKNEPVKRLADLADALKLEPGNVEFQAAFTEASAAIVDDEPTIGSSSSSMRLVEASAPAAAATTSKSQSNINNNSTSNNHSIVSQGLVSSTGFLTEANTRLVLTTAAPQLAVRPSARSADVPPSQLKPAKRDNSHKKSPRSSTDGVRHASDEIFSPDDIISNTRLTELKKNLFFLKK